MSEGCYLILILYLWGNCSIIRRGRRMELDLNLDLHLRPRISMNHILLRRHGGHGPAVEPFGGLRRHVDAAVTVRNAVVVVPVGAVKGDPTLSNVQYPGHAGEVKSI